MWESEGDKERQRQGRGENVVWDRDPWLHVFIPEEKMTLKLTGSPVSQFDPFFFPSPWVYSALTRVLWDEDGGKGKDVI